MRGTFSHDDNDHAAATTTVKGDNLPLSTLDSSFPVYDIRHKGEDTQFSLEYGVQSGITSMNSTLPRRKQEDSQFSYDPREYETARNRDSNLLKVKSQEVTQYSYYSYHDYDQVGTGSKP